MSYTPPLFNAVDFTWQGEVAYTPPINSAVDFVFTPSSAGNATAVATSIAVAAGQALNAQGAGTVVAQAATTATGTAIAATMATASNTSTSSAVFRAIKLLAGSAAGTSTASGKLGSLKDATGTTSGVGTALGVSSVEARDGASTGTTVSTAGGAWDGPSGGDAITNIGTAASGVGRSLALVTAASTVATEVSGTANGIANATFTTAATPVLEVHGAVVLPCNGHSLNLNWNGGTEVFGVSTFESQAVAQAAVTVSWMMLGAIKGDAGFTVMASASTGFVGQAETTAGVTGVSRVTCRGRAYSADGRTSKFQATAESSATGVGEFVHYADAVAASSGESRSDATGSWVLYVETVGTVVVQARAYSFRGGDYDGLNDVYMYTVTKPRQVSIFTGV